MCFNTLQFIDLSNNLKITSMEAIQFLGVSPADLITELKNSLIPELREQLAKEFQPKEPTEYLTRSEVCEMLKINLSTLDTWRKKGEVTAYGIGNRVYYKRSEIDEVLNRNRLK